MQPEFVTVPNSFTAFAGVAGLIAVVTIFYYAFSRNHRYENLIRQQRVHQEQQSLDELPSED